MKKTPPLRRVGKTPDSVMEYIAPTGQHLIIVADGVADEYKDYKLTYLTNTDGRLWLEIEIDGRLTHRFPKA